MANIDIRPINILLDTNIPGKEVISLKKSSLYQPELKNTGNWNETPYFTMDAEYPEGYLSTLPYEKQMEFFFNKKVMGDIIRLRSGVIVKPAESSRLKSQEEQTQERKVENKTKEMEEKVASEKRTEIQKISTQMEKQIQNLEEDTKKKLIELRGSIISELEGKKVKEYQSLEDYKREKSSEIDSEKKELARVLNEMSDFSVIKKIFDISGNKLPIINNDNIDVDKDKIIDVCSLPDIDYSKQFFKNIPNDKGSTDGWDWASEYKKQLLDILNPYQKNNLYKDVLEDIKYIITTIDGLKMEGIDKSQKDGEEDDKKNSKEDDKVNNIQGSVSITKETKIGIIQENMCKLLDEIKQGFNGLKPQITKIMNNNPIVVIDSKIEEYKREEQKLKAEEVIKKGEITTQSEKEKNVLNEASETAQATEKVSTGHSNKVDFTEEAEINRNEIGEKNIMVMIRLMFPTKYPILGNVLSSFHSVVTGKNEFHLKWTDFIPNFLKKKIFEGMSDYSYIKVDGKVYTVIQAIWLNDIYNHKEYGNLINQFEELRKWKHKEAKQSKLDLTKKRDLFRRTYDSKITETDIENIRQTKDNTNISDVSKNERTYGLVTTFNLNIDKLIKIMRNLIDSKDEKSFIDNANNLVDSVKYLKSNQTFSNWFKPDNQAKLDKLVQGMSVDLNKIKIDEYILEKYLTRPGIQIDYTEEKREYRDVLEQKYKLYVNFIENIKKFRKPVLESSNNLLQDSINDFLNNTEKYRGVFNFLMNPINVKSNPFDELIQKGDIGDELGLIKKEQELYHKRLNTGITIRPTAQGNQPYYEIYLQLNLIGGELNDKNKSAIDCMYQGESLGDKLARILNEALYNPWTLNNTRVFFDITKGEAKEVLDKKDKEDKAKEAEKKAKEAKESKSAKPTEPSKKIGGKSTRKYRELFMKTRKRYL
jgi:hypothetical protein